MSRSQSAAVSRRRIRSVLRDLRSETNETQKEVADSLDWSPSKIMRIEGGRVGISTTDLRALLSHYGVDDEDRIAELVELARISRQNTLANTYRGALSKEFAEFLEHEEVARIVRNLQTKVIPGPLQTEDYARILLGVWAGPNDSKDLVDQRAQARLARKEFFLQDDAPDAYFIIDEAALWRQIGSESGRKSLMAEQIVHLKEMARRPNIHIQVVPNALGAYSAMRGPFVILEFEDPDDDNLLYIELPEGEIIVRESPEETAPYLESFIEMERKATRPEDAEAVMDQVLRKYEDGQYGIEV